MNIGKYIYNIIGRDIGVQGREGPSGPVVLSWMNGSEDPAPASIHPPTSRSSIYQVEGRGCNSPPGLTVSRVVTLQAPYPLLYSPF